MDSVMCPKCGEVQLVACLEKGICFNCRENIGEEYKPKKQAMRYNNNKVELTQCPISAIAAISTVLMKNSKRYGGKYDDGNWKLGAPATEYINCCLRHLFAYSSGVDIDETDGLPHLWKSLTNLAMATENSLRYPENDDRFKESPVDFEEFTKYMKKE